MAIFGIKAVRHSKVKGFMNETKIRLESSNYLTNPFTGTIHKIRSTENQYFFIVDMRPIYPNIPLFATFIFLILFVVFPGYAIAIIGLIFFMFSLLWNSKFMSTMLKIGLKKSGYKGKIEYIKAKDCLREVLNNGPT